MSDKYSFEPDIQQEFLQFTVTDIKYGHKALELINSDYFTLIEHSIIAEALTNYYKIKFVVPSQPVLKEELRRMFKLKKWAALVTVEDREKILKIVRKIYSKPVKNADTVYEYCRQFARYSSLKDVLEGIELQDFKSYEGFADKVRFSINIGSNMEEDTGMFVIADAKARITRRKDSPIGHPTPYWQINKMLNNEGTSVGNVIVVMGPAKRFKTGLIINLARGYLKRKKKIFIIDLENGIDSIGLRMDQSIIGKTRREMRDNADNLDQRLLKMLRQYGRFGGDIHIKRFTAGTRKSQIQAYIKYLREERNFNPEILLIDYPDLMGDEEGSKDERIRISNVYVDIKSLAEEEKIQATWCPSHVTRDGDKQQGKKYHATDISKAIDKIRHVDMILGMNQSEEEKEAGVMRLELVDQRDGVQDGAAFFWIDFEKQRLKEFSKKEAQEYAESIKEELEDEKERSGGRKIFIGKGKPKETSDL